MKYKLNQNLTPLLSAMKEYQNTRVVKFDVPGHKGGRGVPELTEFLGIKCLLTDVNSMKQLDNLCHPVSVIKEAQDLTADAFGADNAFFIVSGTTGAVQAMLMSVIGEGDKIIMPRNVHRSAINALVLTGSVPVYVDPGISSEVGIPLAMSTADVEKAMHLNPDAKAIFLNNPTYYGVCANIEKIVETAHSKGMLVLVDEAHGTHFSFGENFPLSAMAAGADMSAVSMHKTGGSLTQSSVLLSRNTVNADYISQIINLTQTTSASYLLMVSLDVTRKHLALHGDKIFAKTAELSEYARNEINKIGGYYAFGGELALRGEKNSAENDNPFYNFDKTKLSVNTREIGLSGTEVYNILRDEYDIQVEFGDIANFLAIISAGDRILEIERLISALSEIKRLYSTESIGIIKTEYIPPLVKLSPKAAFRSSKISLPLREATGRIAGEFVMCYPPGIPILAPGELITKDSIDYIVQAKENGANIIGTMDNCAENLLVVK
ncbi:MAG: aminotransferase class I/II-fold pyridoxal phosphate-dependent enzyme [Ruminococcus sp.]|nr:aminotransferase class I/II-fold pyridoxal phosphate-dependent enzyme [Ruminococcus sp.]